MTGVVNANLEATLGIRVAGSSESALDIACIIDTGFSGALTLPNRLVAALDLEWLSIQNVELADGRVTPCDVYLAAVEWNEQRAWIEVDEAETDPLIGMALLLGFEINIQVRQGGTERVTPLL